VGCDTFGGMAKAVQIPIGPAAIVEYSMAGGGVAGVCVGGM